MLSRFCTKPREVRGRRLEVLTLKPSLFYFTEWLSEIELSDPHKKGAPQSGVGGIPETAGMHSTAGQLALPELWIDDEP